MDVISAVDRDADQHSTKEILVTSNAECKKDVISHLENHCTEQNGEYEEATQLGKRIFLENDRESSDRIEELISKENALDGNDISIKRIKSHSVDVHHIREQISSIDGSDVEKDSTKCLINESREDIHSTKENSGDGRQYCIDGEIKTRLSTENLSENDTSVYRDESNHIGARVDASGKEVESNLTPTNELPVEYRHDLTLQNSRNGASVEESEVNATLENTTDNSIVGTECCENIQPPAANGNETAIDDDPTNAGQTIAKCERTFSDDSTLNESVNADDSTLENAEKSQFICDICGRSLSHQSGLSRHLEKRHGLGPYKCSQCEQRFFRKIGLKIHSRSHLPAGEDAEKKDGQIMSLADKKNQRCQICGKKLLTAGYMETHMKTHTSGKFECNECHIRFSYISLLRHHMKVHTGGGGSRKRRASSDTESTPKRKKKVAEIVVNDSTTTETPDGKRSRKEPVRFEHQYLMEVMMTKNASRSRQKCHICGKKLLTASYMEQHLKKHEEGQLKCFRCKATFTSIRMLTQHVKAHKDKADKELTPKKPKKEKIASPEKSKEELEVFNKFSSPIHDPDRKRYKCNVCGKKMLTESYMTKHLKTHTNGKFQCKECQLTFSYKALLWNHMITHGGSKIAEHFQNEENLQESCLEIQIDEKPGDVAYFPVEVVPEIQIDESRSNKSEFLQSLRIRSNDPPVKDVEAEEPVDMKTEAWHLQQFEFGGHFLNDLAFPSFPAEAPPKKRIRNRPSLKPPKEEKTESMEHPTDVKTEEDMEHSGKEEGELNDSNLKTESIDESNVDPLDLSAVENSTVQQNQAPQTGDKLYECDMCKKRFAQLKYLSKHMKLHSNQKLYDCEKCDKKFILRYYLTKHMKVHNIQKPFECTHCDKKYFHQAALDTHLEFHNEDRPFQCFECGYRFLRSDHLAKHIKTHDVQECGSCREVFPDKELLMQHLELHKGDQLFACDQCNKRYSLQSSLDKHMEIHNLDRPFVCQTCGYRFLRADNLKRHLRTHYGDLDDEQSELYKLGDDQPPSKVSELAEKIWDCEGCDKKFTRRYHLTRHWKTYPEHAQQRQCSECQAVFPDEDSLMQHLDSHSLEKPHECMKCGKRFMLQKYLAKHMKTHEGKKTKKKDKEKSNMAAVGHDVSVDEKTE